ncbi:MAG: response regulator aspartate phosphatase rapC [Verrucomicrobiales bacterium]|nr:response regulator aspartate phosphatase rapC [Verrucomicrobiales bacterium]
MPEPEQTPRPAQPAKKKYVRAVGPRLRILLLFILGLFAILAANSAYLAAISFMEWVKDQRYQNYFYQYMFGAHLLLGIILILPVVIFGIIHIINSRGRPNKRAVSVGYSLFVISLVLLVSGIALMRIKGFIIKNPNFRSPIYWAHVLTPIGAIWLYVLHRLAGPRIKWRFGLAWAGVIAASVVAMVFLHSQDPRKWNVKGPKEGEKYFKPSLAKTATGNFIPAKTMMMDSYCLKCHEDAYKGWFHSSHHFSSFNNKPYLFSVRETRKVSMERDGNVKAARWCAGCHDVVPFFSGAFDNPNFDDVNDPTSQAGITCTACHSITHVNSTVGNADYTIEEPVHYPFAFSTNDFLQFVNNQLIKAKPEFHKKTFLKPLHKSAEFCSTCHKVSIPYELNKYKEFLRGQNHYDTFLLSGVSGHSARSFYYPEKAQLNCNGCHMPIQTSEDFGSKFLNATNNALYIHNHLFPAANTGLAAINSDTNTVKAHMDFLKGNVRVDIFGIRDGGSVDGKLTAPLRPVLPTLEPGKTYLLEVVLRTMKLGHPFTQGTVDSNEVWVDTAVSSAGKLISQSGGLGDFNDVDPYAHFVRVYMLDKEGNRIDRRNPQDIFTPLYNHQIPPGAGNVVHYSLIVPTGQRTPLTVKVKLQYRKFDTTYMQYVFGKNYTNDLPITTISTDEITFPIAGVAPLTVVQTNGIPVWQRWNDYGIGLLLEGDKGSEKGELLQAAVAFSKVEELKKSDGPLNLARVYFKEGRLEDAVEALKRASLVDPPAPRWTIAWLNGMVNKQNGYLDKSISEFRSVLYDKSPELEQRGFDFSKDYEVINELGQTLFERAKMERNQPEKRKQFLEEAVAEFKKTLALDSENVTAHYNLALIYADLGKDKAAEEERKLHERYRVDDNARDRAVSLARRRDKAADHAAQAIVIYSLEPKPQPAPPKAAASLK